MSVDTKAFTDGMAVLIKIKSGIIAQVTSFAVRRANDTGLLSGALRKLAME